MAEISTSSILDLNFYSVAPVARAAGGGVFVSPQANALNLASDDAGRANAAIAARQDPPPPRYVAFDVEGRLVGADNQSRGRLFDISV